MRIVMIEVEGDEVERALRLLVLDAAPAPAPVVALPAAEPAEPAAKPRRTPKPTPGWKPAGTGVRRMIECQEHPGKRFSTDQIAALAKVKRQAVYAALSFAAKHGKPWAKTGEVHVRWETEPLPAQG